MSNFYLGIDQSLTCTGLVILNEDLELVDYRTIRTDKTQTLEDRCVDIANNVCFFGGYHEIVGGAIEGLSFGSNTNATRDLAKLQIVITLKLREARFPDLHTVAPTTLKKFATGSGRADKEQMFQALPEDVKEVFGKIPKTKGRYDLADAYFLAKYSKEC